jgi:hypothetical protein
MSIYVDNDAPMSTDTKKFMDYLKVSDIGYFNRGAYGIGYRVKINEITKSKYNVLSLNNTEKSIKCGQLFVKLVPIVDNKDNNKDTNELLDLIDDILEMSATSSADFLNEIRIQTDVYKKTNNNLEAICPPIVYSNIVNNTEKSSRALNLLSVMMKQMPNDENKVFLARMNSLYEANRGLKLGIIAMSFAQNYDTLHNVLKNTNNAAQKIMYQYLAVYELLRLYDIGYMHGDYHTQNILINTNYKYSNIEDVYLGRALIIDYGLAFKNKHATNDINDISNTASVKLHIMAQEKQPQTRHNAYSWHSYKWLLDFLQTEPELNINYKVLQTSITNFQDQMIMKINENYPGIVTRIRDINESNYRGSILRGGKALYDTQPILKINNMITPIKDNLKIKNITKQKDSLLFNVNKGTMPTISTPEFQKLFNPSNLNMTDIVTNYENTLRDGVLILSTDIKTQIETEKKPIGGKNKKRIVRKTKKSRRKIRKQTINIKTKRTRKRQSRKNKK